MDEQKVRAMLDWPLPRSVRTVQVFLGLAGYYRRFIKNYGAIATPLTALLKNNLFKCSTEVEAAFRALQRALTTASILQLPNFNRDLVVECNASETGLSAVLHQGGGPVAFFSCQLAPRHTKLAAYEREHIGLVQAVHHWCPYLLRRAFVNKTDHFSLKFLLDQRLATIPQHQWASKLIGFDFRIEFRPGAGNVVADTLSRCDMETMTKLAAISAPSFVVLEDLRHEHATDPALRVLQKQVLDGEKGDHWQTVDSLITSHDRVFMPAESPALFGLLAHANGCGHEGTEKALHRLRADFQVPDVRAIMCDIVQACPTCQRNKTEQL
jgi:hypothetical protein